MALGNTATPQHLHRIGILNRNTCSCIFECYHYDEPREHMLKKFKPVKKNKWNLLTTSILKKYRILFTAKVRIKNITISYYNKLSTLF